MINKYVKKAVAATIVSILGTYSPVFAANPTFGIPAGTIPINVNDISRAGAIELLADHFGLKTMFHVPVDGTMQLNLTNSTCDEAITLALAGTGVTHMIENGNLHIFQAREAWNKDKEATAPSSVPAGQIKEPIIAKIVKLKNRSAQDVQKLLKDLDQQISCTFDSPTNSLIIRGEQSKIESCLDLIDGIDALEITENSKQKGMQSSVLVTKTFFLEHADFDAIEQELENVIERDSNSSDSNN